LYYWYFTDNFPGLNEKAAVCSVPLLDGKGRFLGVCGFETGARKFARDTLFDTNITPNAAGLFFTFSPGDTKRFHPGQALFTGNVLPASELSKRHEVSVGGSFRGLEVFMHESGDADVGLWSDITLYTDDSPFVDTRFAAAVVVSGKDFDAIVSASRLRLVLIAALLLCAGVALSLFLSDRYEKPFKELMNALRSGDMSVKSHIQEIDDLVEFMLSQLNETRAAESGVRETAESGGSTEDVLAVFIENTKKLTRAEADVFNLYFEGYTAQEIAEMLNVSLNTIKTHNRRIFAKLNVSSRKELLTWVRILTASGRDRPRTTS
jgi:DNA-binding CsgD family transcriptional regulator